MVTELVINDQIGHWLIIFNLVIGYEISNW